MRGEEGGREGEGKAKEVVEETSKGSCRGDESMNEEERKGGREVKGGMKGCLDKQKQKPTHAYATASCLTHTTRNY